MIKINRKVEYALMVLKFMKGKALDELTTARPSWTNNPANGAGLAWRMRV